DALLVASVTVIVQFEYVPAGMELRTTILLPNTATVDILVQAPPNVTVPAFEEENTKLGVGVVEGVVIGVTIAITGESPVVADLVT
ncbi:hypothetical protein ABFV62_29505, partial [Pseudomonas syringae]|uniref:hypothetical protein n=1 Tax=Pseudomonas syringae TaxID=317 RepID=UPI0034D6C4DE